MRFSKKTVKTKKKVLIFGILGELQKASIPVEVFDACKNLASHSKSAPKPGVPLTDLPGPGDIVGLDAEFIHISEVTIDCLA